MRRLLFALLLACSPLAPAAPASPPQALALTGVPLYLQSFNDCGPASMAMVLGYYGLDVPVSEISKATKPSARSLMSVAAIGAFLGQYGLETVTVQGGQIAKLQKLVALGVPSIVLQYYVEVGKVPHFRVVRGFDQAAQWLYLADPLAGFVKISYRDFDTLWNTQGRTFVAVYPPAMRASVLGALK